MDIASLVATVGGNLGLFLGVSVFRLCEIVEVLIEMYSLTKKLNGDHIYDKHLFFNFTILKRS